MPGAAAAAGAEMAAADSSLGSPRWEVFDGAPGGAAEEGGPRAALTCSQPPNLLKAMDSLRSELSDKNIFIFLDYDGTLTPIVSNPHEATLSLEMRKLLVRLGNSYPVGIVTGRALRTIKHFVTGAEASQPLHASGHPPTPAAASPEKKPHADGGTTPENECGLERSNLLQTPEQAQAGQQPQQQQEASLVAEGDRQSESTPMLRAPECIAPACLPTLHVRPPLVPAAAVGVAKVAPGGCPVAGSSSRVAEASSGVGDRLPVASPVAVLGQRPESSQRVDARRGSAETPAAGVEAVDLCGLADDAAGRRAGALPKDLPDSECDAATGPSPLHYSGRDCAAQSTAEGAEPKLVAQGEPAERADAAEEAPGGDIERLGRCIGGEFVNVMYAASHGFHIEAGQEDFCHKVGQQYLPQLREARHILQERLGHVPGFAVEDNEFAVSVHYRNVPTQCVPCIEQCVDEVLAFFPHLRKTHGKKVFEIKIDVDWDKGRAVLWLLDALGVSPRDDRVLLIYMGDDVTDEDAFRAVKIYPHALAVAVSLPPGRPTAATWRAEGPTEVRLFLEELLNIREEKKRREHREQPAQAAQPPALDRHADANLHAPADAAEKKSQKTLPNNHEGQQGEQK
eukprot:GHVT01089580.1.p1 GENE.GHVT01089580.1~~GHVT01089580.1.p1  ORF type:complete len:625 (-),score=184.43 GHVT01089580.1:1085-2959(-)